MKPEKQVFKGSVERFEYYENEARQFAWRKVAANNEIIAHGEGYFSRSNVLRFLRKENAKLISKIPIVEKK
jgi:uncharacterized protein YegP (UPF0339 family)